MPDALRTPQAVVLPARRTWTLPLLRELPKLTDLTLASSIGGGGGTGGGGSTVFGLLLALLAVGACTSDRMVSPSDAAMPAAVTAVTCTANVPAKVVFCGGPLNVPPTDEIIGGQGNRVILRSANVDYTGTDFTFDVTVQNVGAQTLGTDGTFPTGVRVFFENDPVATGGSGAITVEDDSTGTFTAAGQSYYVYADSLPTHATSSSVLWRFSVPGGVTSFTFQVLVSSQVPISGAILRFTPITSLTRVRYNSIAWSGGSDAMAVGEEGLSSRWNGTTWTPIAPISGRDFIKVASESPGVYIAIVEGGGVYRFSGKVWNEVWETGLGVEWREIWARGADEWVAVGTSGAVLTRSGGTFTEQLLPGGEELKLIAGTGDGVATMVASQSGENYLSVLGGPFSARPNLLPLPNHLLYGIVFDGAGFLIRSQINLATYQGTITRAGTEGGDLLYSANGTLVTEMWPFSGDSLIAFNADLLGGSVTAVKVRFTGLGPHTSVPVSPTVSDPSPFDATRLNGTGTSFAMIDNSQAIQTSIGGGAWTPFVDANNGPFVASWGQGDSVWVAEGSGELWKIVDGVATPLIGVEGARDIWGVSGDELYIVADSFVYRGDGVAPWTLETQLDNTAGFLLFQRIWGDPVSGTLIVTAFNGRYMQRIGGTWSEPITGGGGAEGIWGCSVADVWIATGDGSILKWSPGGLTVDATYTGGDPVRFLTGTGCGDVWAGGPNSALYHYDGVAWTPVPIAGDQIFISALASQSPGVVYVGGEQSKIAVVSMAGITSRMLASPQWDDVLTLWRLDNGELFVGGNEHATIGRR
jgi:hypothetical protein